MHGYQEIQCHIIFDVNMDFTWKVRFVANDSKNEAPFHVTYSNVVPRDIVQLELLTESLNDLDVMACEIVNAYLNAPGKDKIWFKAGA